MSNKTTSIALGEHFAQFAAQQVASGRFGSVSEVVRAALRLFEERETKLATLREALDEARRSPIAESYSLERVLDEIERTPKR